MENKIGCLILVLLIVTSVFSQNEEDRYVKLSQFESKEFSKKTLESGNSYLIHQNNGDVQSLEIRKYKNEKKHGEWLTFLKTVGSIDLVNVCNYDKGLKNGYFFDTDNHTYYEEGYYKNGEKYGLWTKKIFFDNDIIETTIYNKKGKKHGNYTKIDFEFEEKEVISYKNGKRHGKYYLENKKYKKTIVGTYKNDLKHGIWITTDKYLTVINKDGSKAPSIKREYYKNGKLIKTE